jgi:hypothetical protein
VPVACSDHQSVALGQTEKSALDQRKSRSLLDTEELVASVLFPADLLAR